MAVQRFVLYMEPEDLATLERVAGTEGLRTAAFARALILRGIRDYRTGVVADVNRIRERAERNPASWPEHARGAR